MTPLRPVLGEDALIAAAGYELLGPLLMYVTALESYADSLESQAVEQQRQAWMHPSLTGGTS